MLSSIYCLYIILYQGSKPQYGWTANIHTQCYDRIQKHPDLSIHDQPESGGDGLHRW